MNSMNKFDDACSVLCDNLRKNLISIDPNIKNKVQEIRIRVNKPIIIVCANETLFLTCNGNLTNLANVSLLIVNKEDIVESFRRICSYSVYSYQNEIIQGYMTIKGGHRIGICGTAVINSNYQISNIKDISSLNIRIAREIKGIANNIISRLPCDNGLLLVGPPSCGKTTLLRDMARILSNGSCGYYRKVVVVDERGELSSTYMGVMQNDLGLSDVLNGYPKGIGMIQAIRCLSPDIIICDELGSSQDILSINEGLNSGVSIISTIHARSIDELISRENIRNLIETNAFKNIVILKDRQNPGQVDSIYEVGEIYDEIDRLYASNAIRDHNRIYGVA